jgi:hypothetical protein
MITERPPRNAAPLAEFLKSDQLNRIDVPQDARLRAAAMRIESVMKAGRGDIGQACIVFLETAAEFYGVQKPRVHVLAARPLRTREGGWTTEIFGDYAPDSMLIRVWTRTAVRKQVTSFGTFLSTLCHEFCHHLDFQRFGFRNSPHTRGFYERVAVLYHHARGTPLKRLAWKRLPGSRWRVDWQRMTRVR